MAPTDGKPKPAIRGRKEEEEEEGNLTTRTIVGGGHRKRKRKTTSSPNPNPAAATKEGASSSCMNMIGEEQAKKAGQSTSNNSPNPVHYEVPGSPSRYDDDDYDPPFVRPSKEKQVKHCAKRLPKIRKKGEKKLETLADYLRTNGIGEGKSSQEAFEDALSFLIDGKQDFGLKEEISKKVGKYIARRLFDVSRLLWEIGDVGEDCFDASIASTILLLLDSLKDIKLKARELEAVEAACRVLLSVPQEAQVLMSSSLNQLVVVWLKNASGEYSMMKQWAKNPSWDIETRRNRKQRR